MKFERPERDAKINDEMRQANQNAIIGARDIVKHCENAILMEEIAVCMDCGHNVLFKNMSIEQLKGSIKTLSELFVLAPLNEIDEDCALNLLTHAIAQRIKLEQGYKLVRTGGN